MVLTGLFFVALFAATVLPLQSEALLTGLIISEQYSLIILIMVASLGNIMGSMINWWLGRSIELLRHKRWLQKKEAALTKAHCWYHRYGKWSLLFSWVPVIGDPLTIIAGVLREPLWSFLLIVSFAKVVRYCVVAFLVLGWL